MNFFDMDQKMRVHETSSDTCVLPGIYMVARLDGRGFTRLTKQVCNFEAPYDSRFRDLMLVAARSVMNCGFHVIYAYIQSDEISLLLAKNESLFGRKLRKFNSILAAQASATLSVELGNVATFDCRISQLPTQELVSDYFRWRAQDAFRNALNSHCYWALRHSGQSAKRATRRLHGMNFGQKHDLLFREFDTNFNDLPTWQKQGVGLYWESFTRSSINPITQEIVQANRRRVKTELELPTRSEYFAFLQQRIEEADAE